MSDSATAKSDNEKNSEILNNQRKSSFNLKASMLRPSAFGNNAQSTTSSSTNKSILRPSSFSLAASTLSPAKSNEADAAENEASPVPTPTSSSPIEDEPPNADVNNTNDEPKGADSTTGATVNPFSSTKVLNDNEDDENERPNNVDANKDSSTSRTETTAAKPSVSPAVLVTETPTPSVTVPVTPSLLNKNNLFVPKTTNLFAATTNSDNNIGFVFGQNIHERTAGAPEHSASNHDDSNTDSTSSDKLFAAAANQVSSSSASSTLATQGAIDGTSEASASGREINDTKESSTVEDLTKMAQAYEESRGKNKRKYDEVETVTGEEEETNVLNVNCKLFAFVNSNWEERGPGSLRLNDPRNVSPSNAKCSRIVFRTSGNLRVLLNTKVWAEMVVEKPSQKSLRLTAIDSSDGQAKIFLAMARPDDITSLYSSLKKRIAVEKERAQSQPDDGETPTSASGPNDDNDNNVADVPPLKRSK